MTKQSKDFKWFVCQEGIQVKYREEQIVLQGSKPMTKFLQTSCEQSAFKDKLSY